MKLYSQEHQSQIRQQSATVRRAYRDFEELDDESKRAKKRLEVEKDKLIGLCSQDDAQPSLFLQDGDEQPSDSEPTLPLGTPAETDGTAGETEPPNDGTPDTKTETASVDWQELPISNLKLTRAQTDSLAEAEIATLQDLDVWISEAPEKWFAPLAGIGKKAAAKISEKLDAAVKPHQPSEAEPLAEEDTDSADNEPETETDTQDGGIDTSAI